MYILDYKMIFEAKDWPEKVSSFGIICGIKATHNGKPALILTALKK